MQWKSPKKLYTCRVSYHSQHHSDGHGKVLQQNGEEAAVLIHAANDIREQISDAKNKVVIFTDSLSIVTALNSKHSPDLSDLMDSPENLTKCFRQVVIQCVPEHCEILENDARISSQKAVERFNRKT